MTDFPAVRDWLATLCYGTLHERLTAAVAISEDARQAAAVWNDYADMLGTLGVSVQSIAVTAIDPLLMQRRILSSYAGHPLLRPDETLEDILARRPLGLDSLVATGCSGETARQAAYIDTVRRELGLLDAYRATA